MAIKALSWMVRIYEPPVYCHHEIVHNASVVEHFRRQGVVFVDAIDEVPEGAPIMLSAHGSSPEVVAAARARSGALVNAVCPLVTKVHHEVKLRAKKGYSILYVGHRGHQEAIGTVAEAPEAVHLIESQDDLDSATASLPEGPVAFLAQTTLSVDEWEALRDAAQEQHEDLWMPNRSDLCYATTNRQYALRQLCKHADAVVVVGSANSSNTVALTKVAKAEGVQRVLRVNSADELPDDLSGVVGVTAGASAPDNAVQAVVQALQPTNGVTLVSSIEEEEYFPPPRELRELLDTLSLAVATTLGLRVSADAPLADDRTRHADVFLASPPR